MSDERRGASGGFGAMFVVLIFVGAIVKFWVVDRGRIRRRGAFRAAAVGGVLCGAPDRRSRGCALGDRRPGRSATCMGVLAGDDRGTYGDYVPTQIVGHFP
jgi:hypothetical protein